MVSSEPVRLFSHRIGPDTAYRQQEEEAAEKQYKGDGQHVDPFVSIVLPSACPPWGTSHLLSEKGNTRAIVLKISSFFERTGIYVDMLGKHGTGTTVPVVVPRQGLRVRGLGVSEEIRRRIKIDTAAYSALPCRGSYRCASVPVRGKADLPLEEGAASPVMAETRR